MNADDVPPAPLLLLIVVEVPPSARGTGGTEGLDCAAAVVTKEVVVP
jgi:hypothetical protein